MPIETTVCPARVPRIADSGLACVRTNHRLDPGSCQRRLWSALPGVTVSVSGPQMPLARTMTSRQDGVFQFLNLIPGTYQLRAELAGMGAFQQEVIVSLSKVTEVWPVVRATAAEEVTVTAATPLVDTKSSDVSAGHQAGDPRKAPLTEDILRDLPARPRHHRQRRRDLQHEHRDQRRRRAPGQHVPLRRGQCHEPVLRRPLPGLRRARHRGGQHHSRRRRARVRPDGRLHRQRRDKVGLQRPPRRGASRLHSRRARGRQQVGDPEKIDRFRPGVGVGGPIWKDHLFAYGSVNLFYQDEKDRTNSPGRCRTRTSTSRSTS